MLRLIGCGLILAAGCGAALLCVRTQRRRLEVLDAWIELIAHARLQIDHFLTPKDEILATADAELLRRLGGVPADSSFPSLLRQTEGQLSDGARRLVVSFVEGIGNGYREEQVRACDYYIDALRVLYGREAEALPARMRVQVALCLTTALGAAILLW